MSNYDESRRQCEMALRELSRVEKALCDAVEQVANVRRYVQEASDRAQAILETRPAKREPK